MLQSWQSREIEIDRDVIFNFYPKVHLFYKSFKLKLVFVCCVTIHVLLVTGTPTSYKIIKIKISTNGLQRFSLSPFLPLPL